MTPLLVALAFAQSSNVAFGKLVFSAGDSAKLFGDAPGRGRHSYRLISIPAARLHCEPGDVITFVVSVGTVSNSRMSFDLFRAGDKIPASGFASSLAHVYRVNPGTIAHFNYTYQYGDSNLLLGGECDWDAALGSRNRFQVQVYVH
jgi:hypothetical protein